MKTGKNLFRARGGITRARTISCSNYATEELQEG